MKSSGLIGKVRNSSKTRAVENKRLQEAKDKHSNSGRVWESCQGLESWGSQVRGCHSWWSQLGAFRLCLGHKDKELLALKAWAYKPLVLKAWSYKPLVLKLGAIRVWISKPSSSLWAQYHQQILRKPFLSYESNSVSSLGLPWTCSNPPCSSLSGAGISGVHA